MKSKQKALHGIVLNGSGSDERIDWGQPGSRGAAQFNGCQ